jgi:uncharacterized protein YidB (DUF937 family)
MGILGDIVGKVFSSGGTQSNLVNEVMGLLNNQQMGGIEGLVQKFSGKGLGDIVNSWVGTGQNLPVSPQQIQQALGNDTIKQFASKMGVNPDQVTQQLSDLLPKVVDKLTPNGQIPQGDLMSKGMDLLKGFMK